MLILDELRKHLLSYYEEKEEQERKELEELNSEDLIFLPDFKWSKYLYQDFLDSYYSIWDVFKKKF